MVLANHVIFGAYGFWLPNDPRGSWSEFVGGVGVVSLWTGDDNLRATIGCSSIARYWEAIGREDGTKAAGRAVQRYPSAGGGAWVR